MEEEIRVRGKDGPNHGESGNAPTENVHTLRGAIDEGVFGVYLSSCGGEEGDESGMQAPEKDSKKYQGTATGS
ncbi:hypothetical protein U1Q18_017412 [Sarracenia purpurea var. burkii]